jgi:GNAT superfamily N-acetyltransferase
MEGDAALVARHAASQRAFYAAIAPGTPGGVVVSLPGGVQASMVPAARSRSLLNAVVYDDPELLLRQRDGIEEAYGVAGIEAWTVWVKPGDEDVARELEAAGHRLDGRPRLMAAELGSMDLGAPEPPVLPDREPTWAEVAAANDAAYGAPPERSFVPALRTLRRRGARPWVSWRGEEVASALATFLHDDDCYVALVATVPAFRRRGLAIGLLRRALRTLRDEDGAVTTTLEASAAGAPLYERLGYRARGDLSLWERRRGGCGSQHTGARTPEGRRGKRGGRRTAL